MGVCPLPTPRWQADEVLCDEGNVRVQDLTRCWNGAESLSSEMRRLL